MGIEIILGELLVLDAHHLIAQAIDARIIGDVVFIVGGGESAVDQGHGHHVLDAMVAIGGIVKRALLVDDANRRFLRSNGDLADVGDPVDHLGMERHRAFDRSLGVKFRGKADLEQHVLHDVAAEGTLELERLTLE